METSTMVRLYMMYKEPTIKSTCVESDKTHLSADPSDSTSSQIATVSLASKYVRTLVLRRLRSPSRVGGSYQCTPKIERGTKLVFSEYERIPWESVLSGDEKAMRSNAYCVRRGLTRKAGLAQVVEKYVDTRPGSFLAKCVPKSLVVTTWQAFDSAPTSASATSNGAYRITDPAAALNDCLWEAELAIREAASTDSTSRWLLKPNISSKGDAITTLSTTKELREAVKQRSDVREWVLQQYVPRILLLDGARKFHLRVFVVCVGALKAYVLKDYIAFFATEAYTDADNENQFMHITNAAHQKNHASFVEEDSFRASSELPKIAQRDLGMSEEEAIFEFTHENGRVLKGIASCVSELFTALAKQPAVFQPLAHCFEHYGVDFILDQDLTPWLLEFNSGPDLEQAGDRLKPIIETLMDGVVELGVDGKNESRGFFKCFEKEWPQAAGSARKVQISSDEEDY